MEEEIMEEAERQQWTIRQNNKPHKINVASVVSHWSLLLRVVLSDDTSVDKSG